MSEDQPLKVGDDVAIKTTVGRLDRPDQVGFRLIGTDDFVYAETKHVRPLRKPDEPRPDAFPIVIKAEPGSQYYTVESGGRRAKHLVFDEMLGAVISSAHPEIKNGPRYLTGASSEATPAAQPGETVTLTLSLANAENLSAGMADFLCWCRGYVAATDDADKHPMGVAETRSVRVALDAAIAKAKGVEAKEYPF